MRSMNYVPPASDGLVMIIISAVVLLIIIALARRSRSRNFPPSAGNWVPLLGHALAYKSDPASFITKQCEKLGPCFSINLAGKRMVIVAHVSKRQATSSGTAAGSAAPAANDAASLVKRVAWAPESVLSARQAVLDIGFDETLGALNVTVGTDLHKRIVKAAYFTGTGLAEEVPKMFMALGASIARRLATTYPLVDGGGGDDGPAAACSATPTHVVADLFDLVRAAMLRTSIERMLGSRVLAAAGEGIVDEFMSFQDAVEDATAKAAVLPRTLAKPMVLWPVRRKRAAVSGRLAAALTAARLEAAATGTADDGLGPWVRALMLDDGRSAEEVAELACGLLFAAHKNPAIGAAQALLLTLSAAPQRVRERAREEAAALHASPSLATLEEKCGGLRAACDETMRLCAHTIGAVRKVVAPEGFELRFSGEGGEGGEGGGAAVYHLPAGTTIALAHIPTHRDGFLWGDCASQYDPTRAEWQAGGPRPDEYTLTTFSQGLHRCPGERLALPMMQCALAQLLNGDFETSLVPDRAVPPIDFERATLAQRAGPVAVRVAVRMWSGGKNC
jgi:cytochrome P450